MARILLVEDDESMVDLLAQAFETWGHDVSVVQDGSEAYRRVYVSWPAYDLLICDLALPSMQGHDLLRRLERQLRERTPVIVVSGRERLIDSLGDVANWVFEILRKPFRIPELQRAVEAALEQRQAWLGGDAGDQSFVELQKRVDALVAENVGLFEQARLDPLTRLPNRRRLEEDLDKKWANTDRYGSPFAFALGDVDDFRKFNTDLGYEGGDRAVRHVAQLLDAATREGDTVYRYGGDEFVVVMEAQSLDQGVRVADRLRAALEAAPVPEPLVAVADRITMSIGVAAAVPGESRSTSRLLRQANRHLDEAKLAGGNCVRPVSLDGGPAES